VRYRGTDYSVPTAYGHREVVIRGYVHEVVISCGAEVIARHPRSYEREDFAFDPTAWGIPGVLGVTVRLKGNGELTLRKCCEILDQRQLTTAAQPPCVGTPSTPAERRDVEKPAHHRHVFQEMDLLIAVGEVRMPNQGGGDAP
jgi:hypothetical protein